MNDLQPDRQVKRRLAIHRHAEEVTGNIAMTCRYFGISRRSPAAGPRNDDSRGRAPRRAGFLVASS